MKHTPPAIDQTAFNCPHCGALATQFWYSVHVDYLGRDNVPFRVTPAKMTHFDSKEFDPQQKDALRQRLERLATGRPFIDSRQVYTKYDLANASVSKCFNCDDVALWINDRLFWPAVRQGPPANADLPTDVRRDYDEASTILNLSPRGAAALLRLAIQKLCMHLGQPGNNINADIAALAKNGLDVRVQKALDIVRVVGNNAVHPGQLDLRDDHATAEKLFGLVNLITDIMITQPKHIEEMFDGLPEAARTAIEKRDSESK
jgi:hypothetical protein